MRPWLAWSFVGLVWSALCLISVLAYGFLVFWPAAEVMASMGGGPAMLAVAILLGVALLLAVLAAVTGFVSRRAHRLWLCLSLALGLGAVCLTIASDRILGMGLDNPLSVPPGLPRPVQRLVIAPYLADHPGLARMAAELHMWRQLRALARQTECRRDVALAVAHIHGAPADLDRLVREEARALTKEAQAKEELFDWESAADLWQQARSLDPQCSPDAGARAAVCERWAHTPVTPPVLVTSLIKGVPDSAFPHRQGLGLLWCPPFRKVQQPLRVAGNIPRRFAGKRVFVRLLVRNRSRSPVSAVTQEFALVDLAGGRFHGMGTRLLTQASIPPNGASQGWVAFDIPAQFREGVGGLAGHPDRASEGFITVHEARGRDVMVSRWLRLELAVGSRWTAVLIPPPAMPEEFAKEVLSNCLYDLVMLCTVGDARYQSRP